jgi:hypothetical protein
VAVYVTAKDTNLSIKDLSRSIFSVRLPQPVSPSGKLERLRLLLGETFDLICQIRGGQMSGSSQES